MVRIWLFFGYEYAYINTERERYVSVVFNLCTSGLDDQVICLIYRLSRKVVFHYWGWLARRICMLWQPQLVLSDNNNNSFSNEVKLHKKKEKTERTSTLQQFEVKQQRKKSVSVAICKPWFRTVTLYFFGNKSALFRVVLLC